MRVLVKRFLFLIGLILASPLIILTLLESLIFGKEAERVYGSSREILSIIPTPIGNMMRKAFYWSTCAGVTWDAHFIFGSWLAHRENYIGHNVSIGAYSFIGRARVGDNVLFGARVSVVSGKYEHGRPEDRVEGAHEEEETVVLTIGSNSWIGQDVVIMANVGENCTVGAGSVVMKDVPDNTTVLGNPARKVSMS